MHRTECYLAFKGMECAQKGPPGILKTLWLAKEAKPRVHTAPDSTDRTFAEEGRLWRWEAGQWSLGAGCEGRDKSTEFIFVVTQCSKIDSGDGGTCL